MIGDAIAHAMMMAMVAVAVITALVVLFLIFGVPMIWGWVKPLIHSLTG